MVSASVKYLCAGYAEGKNQTIFQTAAVSKFVGLKKSIFFRRDNENKLKLDFKKRITSKASTSRIKTSNAKHAKQKLTRLNQIR